MTFMFQAVATMFHALFETQGFKLWWVHPNAAKSPGARMHPALRRLPYSKAVWEAGPPPMAWEIALRRVPPGGEATAPARCPKGARSAFPRPKHT